MTKALYVLTVTWQHLKDSAKSQDFFFPITKTMYNVIYVSVFVFYISAHNVCMTDCLPVVEVYLYLYKRTHNAQSKLIDLN